MKIGLVCPYNMSRGGGVQEIVRDLQVGLRKKGHEVKIITPLPRENEEASSDDVIFLGNGADFRSPLQTMPTFSLSVDSDEIDEMLAREQFDVLHFHEPWVPILSRQILGRSKAVNIGTFHAKVPETLMSRTVIRVVTPYTKTMLKGLHALSAVSNAAAEYVSSLTDEPITIIPNGIDLTRFGRSKLAQSKLALPKDRKTILYIGRLERRKGVKYLLEAYQRIAASRGDVQLIIAGDGPDREKLEMMAQDAGLRHVSFLGFVSDEQKMALLAAADLLAAPAIYGESFGLILLEAMASGLVTVAGDNSGYVAVMQEMGALSLVNPRETEEFARRLELLLVEEKLRSDWRTWAKKYIKQYDYPIIVDRYEALYQHALKHHRHHVKTHD